MKSLLVAVNAKYIHSNPALYSLRAYASKKSQGQLEEHIEIAEYTINHKMEAILADIYLRKPDMVAFSCYIWNWNLIQEILVELHKLLPQIPIWLGGPEVSYDARTILERYPFLSGIMVGEGEETYYELLSFYLNNKTMDGLNNISGIVTKDGIFRERELTNLSLLPFLYENLEPFENRIVYYESVRGCPYRCSYCLSSIDKKVRLRDLSVVKKELQFFLDHKLPQVKFVDRTFNCNHQHAMEIWKYIQENDNLITNFHFEIAAEIITQEEIQLLNSMRPGLIQLEIGVQSTNETTLREINRTMDTGKLKNVVAQIQQAQNIHVHLDLIAGLPYEDMASFENSFNQVYAMEPEQLQLGFLKVLKGSYMYDMVETYGICYTEKPPYEVLYTNWLSYEEILHLKKVEEMVEVYYNSNQFTYTLPALMKNFESSFRFFEKLAEFYQEKGYFTNSPSRMYRYDVLLEFARSINIEDEKYYSELLTFDMYLRENMKSRPVFASDLEPFKDRIRTFYQTEEENHQYLEGYEGYQARQLVKMTHLEIFTYPVWELHKTVTHKTELYKTETHNPEFPDESRAQVYGVLFDYKKRNPLNSQAKIFVLDQF